MSKPQFKHDCDHCEFIGHYVGHDVYKCKNTIIARSSDDGPDYGSYDINMLKHVLVSNVSYTLDDGSKVVGPYITFIMSKYGSKTTRAMLVALLSTCE